MWCLLFITKTHDGELIMKPEAGWRRRQLIHANSSFSSPIISIKDRREDVLFHKNRDFLKLKSEGVFCCCLFLLYFGRFKENLKEQLETLVSLCSWPRMKTNSHLIGSCRDVMLGCRLKSEDRYLKTKQIKHFAWLDTTKDK